MIPLAQATERTRQMVVEPPLVALTYVRIFLESIRLSLLKRTNQCLLIDEKENGLLSLGLSYIQRKKYSLLGEFVILPLRVRLTRDYASQWLLFQGFVLNKVLVYFKNELKYSGASGRTVSPSRTHTVFNIKCKKLYLIIHY